MKYCQEEDEKHLTQKKYRDDYKADRSNVGFNTISAVPQGDQATGNRDVVICDKGVPTKECTNDHTLQEWTFHKKKRKKEKKRRSWKKTLNLIANKTFLHNFFWVALVQEW